MTGVIEGSRNSRNVRKVRKGRRGARGNVVMVVLTRGMVSCRKLRYTPQNNDSAQRRKETA